MSPAHICCMAIGGVACATDLRTRRIPNVLTFGAALAGLMFQFATGGVGALGQAALGWLLGALVFLIPFALGGMGGGDVKLLAALGAWLGPLSAIWVGLYAGVAGAIMAVLVSVYSGYSRQALSNVWNLLKYWSLVGMRPLHEVSLEGHRGPRLAYALPIFAGLLIAIWPH